MRLTSFTDYGLRILMRMASAPEQAFSTADLAEEFDLSRNHLTKIVQQLSRGGIVETRRGGGGGAVLARDPAEIRLGDVVRLLEREQALVECFRAGGGSCVIEGCCRLRVRLYRAEARFIEDLNCSTLADVALPVREEAA
ncbi:MAG: RrF2 family transcriptional regulator [Tropicimonas sp.]|uniref:RrF2 family transcriptional regulator n=1 Tax=Tropicimonas sp. TaxID=2067044 RepID=UPI003A880407